MKAKPPKGKPGGSEPTPGATADDLPERWSVQRKMELVLQLLRGEALDAVSRESHSAGARAGALATDLPGAGQARAAHEGRAGGAGADPGPRENRRADDAPGVSLRRSARCWPRVPFMAKAIGRCAHGSLIVAARSVVSACSG